MGRELAESGAAFKFGPAEGVGFFVPYGWEAKRVEGLLKNAAILNRAPAELLPLLPEPKGSFRRYPWRPGVFAEKVMNHAPQEREPLNPDVKYIVKQGPGGSLVEKVSQIWQRIFQRTEIRFDENFFKPWWRSLDGHPTLREIEKATGRLFSPMVIYQAPTIASLSAFLKLPNSAVSQMHLAQIRETLSRQCS